MKNQRLLKDYILLPILALCIQACYQSPQAGTSTSAPTCATQMCSSSSECGLGEICAADGCCLPWVPQEGSCDEADPTCMTIDRMCNEHDGGCECHILDMWGSTASASDPVLTVTPHQSLPIIAQLAKVGADPINETNYIVSSDNPECLSIAGNVISTYNRPCEAIVTVEFGKSATCSARVTGLGDVLEEEAALVYIVDEETRRPINADALIIDLDNDGIRDLPALRTEQHGVYLAEVEDTTTATITVFAQGYHYLTIAGIELTPGEPIFIPVTEHQPSPLIGGASGKLDLHSHRETVLFGRSHSIQLGMVASALDLGSLPNFNIERFLGGPLPTPDCEATPSAAGCYEIGIPGVYETSLPVWGGLVFSFQDDLMKPHFEIQTQSGRPYIWGIGGEWKLDEVDTVARAFLIDESCTSDGVANQDCIRRTTRSLLKNLSPLMARASLGVRGNLGLEQTEASSWDDYISQSYGPERLEQSTHPILDPAIGNHQALNLNQPLNKYTSITLPELPSTPEGGRTDTVIAMTGVSSRTGGFVPLGFTAGFDCANDDCLDDSALLGDGIIDGQQLCDPRDDATEGLCRDDAPEYQPAGSVGLFHSAPNEFLMGEPLRTVVLAMELDGLAPSTLSGILLDGSLPPNSLSLEGTHFLDVDTVEVLSARRLIQFTELRAREISQVVISQDESALNWKVIGDTAVDAVVLPVPPSDYLDPMTDVDGVISTKLKLRPMESVQNHLEDFVSGIDRIFDDVVAFSTTKR